jgi:hypothetical protein
VAGFFLQLAIAYSGDSLGGSALQLCLGVNGGGSGRFLAQHLETATASAWLFAGVFSALLWHAAVFYGSGRFWALGQHLIGANKLTSHTLEKWKSQEDLERITQLLDNSLVGHHGLEVIFLSPNHDVIFATPNANFSLDLVATSAARSPHRPITTTQGEQTYRSIAAELPTSKAAEAVFSVLPFYESILPRFMVCLSRFIVQSSLAVCYRTDVGRMSA